MFTSQVELEKSVDLHNEEVILKLQESLNKLRGEVHNEGFSIGYFLEHYIECESKYLLVTNKNALTKDSEIRDLQIAFLQDHIDSAALLYGLVMKALIKTHSAPAQIQDIVKSISLVLTRKLGISEINIVRVIYPVLVATIDYAVSKGILKKQSKKLVKGGYAIEYQLSKDVFPEQEKYKLRSHSIPMIKPPLKTTGVFDNQRYSEGSDYLHTGMMNVSLYKQTEEVQQEVDKSRTEENCEALHTIATTPYLVNPKYKVIARLTEHLKGTELRKLKKEIRSHK